MSTVAQKILSEIKQLSEEERDALIEQILIEQHSPNDEDVEKEWEKEIERRVAEVDRGEVELVPWEIVRERARKKYGV